MKSKAKSEEELLLKEWKERLGLQDWKITLYYNCNFEDMELGEVCGETHWTTPIKEATISIIGEEEYGEDRTLKYDFEKTLVHELLHIKFSLIDLMPRNGGYEANVAESVRHQLIDDLARALVAAKRNEITLQRRSEVKVVCMHGGEECE